MTISSTSTNVIIFLFTLSGIGYFVAMAFINKIIQTLTRDEIRELITTVEKKKDDENAQPAPIDDKQDQNQEKKDEQDCLMNDDDDDGDSNKALEILGQETLITKYEKIFQQIDKILMVLYVETLWKGIVFTLAIWLIFTSWFVWHDTYLQSFLATLFGIFSASTVSFISLKFSSSAITRALLTASQGEFRAFAGNWISSSAISIGVVSMCLFFHLCVEPINKYMYMGDGEDDPPIKHLDFAQAYENLETTGKLQHLYLAEVGFALAIITCSSFMRDIPKILGTGLIIGHDLAGKLKGNIQENEPIDLTLKKTTMIGYILSQNMVNSIDTLCVISTTLVGISLLTSYTTLVAYHEHGAFEFPLLVLSIMLFVCVVVSAMGLTYNKDDPKDQNPIIPVDRPSIPTFTSNQIRLMLLIINTICAIIFLILPLLCYPNETFDILRNQPTYPFHFTNGSPFCMIWCLELGLLGQTVFLFVSESFTSHAFLPTQKSAKNTLLDTSYGMITMTRVCSVAHLILVGTLAFCIFLAYTQGGFYGIALMGIAFSSSPAFFLGVSMFAFLTEEALTMSNYGKEMHYLITFRLNKMAWASRNYIIFLPLINTSGMFVINLVLIGLFCVIGEVNNIIIWDGLVIYGFLVGSAIAYFLKSQNVHAIQELGQDILRDKHHSQLPKDDPHYKDVFQNEDPNDILPEKINDTQFKTIVNILVCTGTILLVSWLFGERGLVGYMCGLNMVAIHLMYLSILKYQSAKNIRDYNEHQINELSTKSDPEGYAYTISLSVSQSATESDSLMIYVLFNILFILQGARILALGGFLGNFLEKESSEISNKAFNSTIGQAMRESKELQKEIDEIDSDIANLQSDVKDDGGAAVQHDELSMLQNRLAELKLEDKTILVRLKEDQQALIDLKKQQNGYQTATQMVQTNMARARDDQRKLRAEIAQIMQQIQDLKEGGGQIRSAGDDGEAFLMLFWSI